MEKKGFWFDLKKDSLTDDGTFKGHASVFGNIDSYGDIIEKGAFTKTLKEGKEFPLLYNHDTNELLGGIEAKQDRYGLDTLGSFELAVKRAEEIYLFARKGIIKGLSIGYSAMKTVDEKIDGQIVRVIKELRLFEVSLVLFPANELANVEAVKSYEENLIEEIKKRKDDKEFKKKALALFEEPENTSTLIEQPKCYVEFLEKVKEVF
jgi:HK97 family phage prohead protease